MLYTNNTDLQSSQLAWSFLETPVKATGFAMMSLIGNLPFIFSNQNFSIDSYMPAWTSRTLTTLITQPLDKLEDLYNTYYPFVLDTEDCSLPNKICYLVFNRYIFAAIEEIAFREVCQKHSSTYAGLFVSLVWRKFHSKSRYQNRDYKSFICNRT